MVLFIISVITASLIIMICIVQSFQTRRKITSIVTGQQNNLLQNSHSTTNTDVNR